MGDYDSGRVERVGRNWQVSPRLVDDSDFGGRDWNRKPGKGRSKIIKSTNLKLENILHLLEFTLVPIRRSLC